MISVNILGTFCHLWFFCLLVGEALTSIVFARRKLLTLVLGFALSIVPYALLWLPFLLRQLRGSGEAAAWLKSPGLGLIGDMLIVQFGPMALILPMIALSAWMKREWKNIIPVWPILLLVFVLVPPLLLSFWKPFFHLRYTIVASHVLALIFGSLAIRFFDKLMPIQLSFLVFALSLLVYPGHNPCDSRSAARFLADNMRDGDTVIFASLSRQPIDYYLDKVASLRRWHETSFPAEIDSHPGYEGSITIEAQRRGELRAEAVNMVQALMKRPGIVVLFVNGIRPEADQPLLDELKARLEAYPQASLDCPGDGAYFTRISAFRVPSQAK